MWWRRCCCFVFFSIFKNVSYIWDILIVISFGWFLSHNLSLWIPSCVFPLPLFLYALLLPVHRECSWFIENYYFHQGFFSTNNIKVGAGFAGWDKTGITRLYKDGDINCSGKYYCVETAFENKMSSTTL